MDIFGTTLATGTLIVQYVSACAAFSSQARSLSARFGWDLRALEIVRDYFKLKKAQHPSQQLNPKDEVLLQETEKYLNDLVSRAQQNLSTIKRKTFLNEAALSLTWIARRSSLEELEAEIFTWTQRFSLGGPLIQPDLRSAAIPAGPMSGLSAPPVIRSNDRLREFVHLAPEEKKERAEHLLLKDPSKLAARITGSRFIDSSPLQFDNEQFVFASRKVSQKVALETKVFKTIESDVAILAAELNCLDPAADIRLLKVESYFYHGESGQFLFVHHPPYRTMSMTTLERRISVDSFPETEAPLNQRLKLAHKLTEAVLFLHSANFLHKNITSSSVVAFRKWEDESLEEESNSTVLDDGYLMGFELIRGAETGTTKEGAIKEAGDSRSIWEFAIYQHPDRQHGKDSEEYKKVYDVYSLGVVLLELGLWQPLSRVAISLDQGNPSSWPRHLSDSVVNTLGPRIGERYGRLVSWCLALVGNYDMKETDFVEQVLNPLEDMVNALS